MAEKKKETPDERFNRMVKGKENHPKAVFEAKTKSGKGFEAKDFAEMSSEPNSPSNRRILKEELQKDIKAGKLKKTVNDLMKALSTKGVKMFIER